MDFVKRSSTYVEAVKFEGTEESVSDLINLIDYYYYVDNLGIYETKMEVTEYGKKVKKNITFANFLAEHKENQKRELISVPEGYYLVRTKLGLKVVNPIKFESEYKEV